MNSALRRFAGPGLLLIISILFHWKLVLTNQYTWLEAGDIGSLILPWFQFQAGEWHHWRFPLWDPNSWTGQPLIGQAQPGAAYPLNWLLFWMPLDHGWLRQDVLHWWYVLVHYLAGLSCYALCRDLGRSRLASVLGGIVYSLAGYAAYTDSPQMLHGAVWAPLVFLFLFRAERGERPIANAVLSGFFLGVTWLVGHHQMQIFLSLAAAAMWIWICARNRRLVLCAAVAFLMTGLTSAFQTLPAAEYGRQAVRWVGTDEPQGLGETVPYAVHAQYAMKPISLLGIFIAGVEHGPYNAFCGVAAFAFAILGAILWWQQRQVRWLATLALCGILFALGGNSVFHGMLYALAPLVEKARVPEAATVLFAIGVATLAGFGLDALRESFTGGPRLAAAWILAGLGAVLALGSLAFYAAKLPMAISDNRLIITALCAILAAALLAARLSARAASVAAIALVLFELGNVTDYNLATANRATHPYLYKLAEHYDLAAFVRGSRIVYDTTAIPYNIGDWYGIEALNAYAASVPASLWQHAVFSERVQDILGIRYYLGVKPQRADLQEVFQGRSGVKVFENAKAFPRAWAVHRTLEVADPKQARAMLADPGFDALHSVFFIGQSAPKLASCNDDDVWLSRHEPNRVVIQAAMSCRGMVLLTDTWFPGWKATVDGRSVAIEKAYGAFRGVVVDAGDHTIEMRYRPWSVFTGVAMTGLASIFALWMAWRAAAPERG
jgi:membrane protein YfhO